MPYVIFNVVYDTSSRTTTRAAHGSSLMEGLKLSILKQDGYSGLRGSDRRIVIPYIHRDDCCIAVYGDVQALS
jgi:hypothetical protein